MKPVEPIYTAIGVRIVMLRNALGVTQVDLAKRCGWSRPALANIEVGRQRLTLHQIESVATALGTSPKHLLRGIWL
jgi:transcriptional regulator with XRE-family HTH domain